MLLESGHQFQTVDGPADQSLVSRSGGNYQNALDDGLLWATMGLVNHNFTPASSVLTPKFLHSQIFALERGR